MPSPRAGKTNTLAGVPMRLIEVPHPKHKHRPMLIVSNDLNASAEQIAAWYRQRWAIELSLE